MATERSIVFTFRELYNDLYGVLIFSTFLVTLCISFMMLIIFRNKVLKTPEYYHRKDYFLKRFGFSSVWSLKNEIKWIYKCYFWAYEEIYKNFGLDSLILIKTQRMMIIIAFIILIPSVLIILPVHIYVGSKSLDCIARTTIACIPSESPLLWIHFVMMYFETIVIFIVLFIGWKDVAKWKQRYFADNSLLMSTLLFQSIDTNISVGMMQNRLNSQLEKIAPDNNSYVIYILRDYNHVKPLIKGHDQKLLAKRIYESSEINLDSCENSSPLALTRRLIQPQNINSININNVTENYTLLKKASTIANTMLLPAAVVIVSNLGLAQTLRCTSFSGDQSNFKISLCPPAENIVWKNLNLNLSQRNNMSSRLIFGTLFLIFVESIPVILIVCLIAGVEYLDERNGSFPDKLNFIIYLKYFFITILPVILMNLFVAFIPYMDKLIDLKEDHVSQMDIDFSILRKLCGINIFGTFFMFILSATFLENIRVIYEIPLKISEKLAETLQVKSNFYIFYILINGLIIVPWGLLQGNRLIFPFFKKLLRMISKLIYFCTSLILCTLLYSDSIHPLSGEYITKYSKLFSLFGIGLLFNIISPLITVVWVIFFLIAYACNAFDQENNEYPLFSYHGDFWIRVTNWILIYMVTSHCVLLGIFSLKSFKLLVYLSIPCPIISVAFFVYLKCFFKRLWDYPNLEAMGTLENFTFETMSKKQKEYHIEELIPPINMTKEEHVWAKVAICLEANEIA